jgi:F-box protein 42
MAECAPGLKTVAQCPRTVQALPEPVLEYILGHLSPYKDLLQCRLVCRNWVPVVDCKYSAAISVDGNIVYFTATISKLSRDFQACLAEGNLQWRHFDPLAGPSIAGRYSHSACRVGSSLFVFGGCTASFTTFNDLWRFDLTTRTWERPRALGGYPPPKSCATLVSYKRSLILFGGWTFSSLSPMMNAWKTFNHVHEYNLDTQKWTLLETVNEGPGVSGHSARIIDDRMIVFGWRSTSLAAKFGF